MTLAKAFSIRLQQLLKERNITLYKFCNDNGIARSTLLNIIDGNTKSPTLSIVYQVATALDMTAIEFLDCDVFNSNELDYL